MADGRPRNSKRQGKQRKMIYKDFICPLLQSDALLVDFNPEERELSILDWEACSIRYDQWCHEKKKKKERTNTLFNLNQAKDTFKKALTHDKQVKARNTTKGEEGTLRSFIINDENIWQALTFAKQNASGEHFSDGDSTRFVNSMKKLSTTDFEPCEDSLNYQLEKTEEEKETERHFSDYHDTVMQTDNGSFSSKGESKVCSGSGISTDEVISDERHKDSGLASSTSDLRISDRTTPMTIECVPDYSPSEGGQIFQVDVSRKLENDTFFVHFGTYGICETDIRLRTDGMTILKGKQPIPTAHGLIPVGSLLPTDPLLQGATRMGTHTITAEIKNSCQIRVGSFLFKYDDRRGEELVKATASENGERPRKRKKKSNESSDQRKPTGHTNNTTAARQREGKRKHNIDLDQAVLMYLCYEHAKRGDGIFFRALLNFPFGNGILQMSARCYPDLISTAREHGHEDLADNIEEWSRIKIDNIEDLSSVNVKLGALIDAVRKETAEYEDEDYISSESDYFADGESNGNSSEEEQKNDEENAIKPPAKQNDKSRANVDNTLAENTDSFICTLNCNHSETNQKCGKDLNESCEEAVKSKPRNNRIVTIVGPACSGKSSICYHYLQVCYNRIEPSTVGIHVNFNDLNLTQPWELRDLIILLASKTVGQGTAFKVTRTIFWNNILVYFRDLNKLRTVSIHADFIKLGESYARNYSASKDHKGFLAWKNVGEDAVCKEIGTRPTWRETQGRFQTEEKDEECTTTSERKSDKELSFPVEISRNLTAISSDRYSGQRPSYRTKAERMIPMVSIIIILILIFTWIIAFKWLSIQVVIQQISRACVSLVTQIMTYVEESSNVRMDGW